MEIMATNRNIDNMAIWPGKANMTRLYRYTHTTMCEIRIEKGL